MKATLLVGMLCIVCILFMACQTTTTQPENDAVTDKKATDTLASTILYNEVIQLHDEAMPKIGPLKGYEKAVQAKIDSLDVVLKGKKNKMAETLKVEYLQLLKELLKADNDMNAWMENFNPDPTFSTEDSLSTYFTAEKSKVEAIRNQIFAVLDSTKKVLGK